MRAVHTSEGRAAGIRQPLIEVKRLHCQPIGPACNQFSGRARLKQLGNGLYWVSEVFDDVLLVYSGFASGAGAFVALVRGGDQTPGGPGPDGRENTCGQAARQGSARRLSTLSPAHEFSFEAHYDL